MSLEQFVNKFSKSEEPVGVLTQQSAPGALDKFMEKFNGNTESYWFYNHTVELRFQPEEHIYYLVGALGELVPQDGVTTIVHIIDKSMALVPWSAKMVVEKLLRTLPTIPGIPLQEASGVCHCGASMEGHPVYDNHSATEQMREIPVTLMAPLSLEEFTKIALEAKTAPRDKLEEAGDVGHMAHTWLEFFIKAILAKDVQTQESKLANMPQDERAHNCVLAALGWMKKHNVRWVATERKVYSKNYSFAGTTDGLALVDSCDDPLCQGCRGEQFKDHLSVIDWKSSNYLYTEYLLQTAAYVEALMEEFGGM
jgi:hypothetical protein